jgi:hypothetical protein
MFHTLLIENLPAPLMEPQSWELLPALGWLSFLLATGHQVLWQVSHCYLATSQPSPHTL